jgi:hypothetical protein
LLSKYYIPSREGDKWSGWCLAIFEEEQVDKALLDVVEKMTAAVTGVKIKSRRRYLKNYGRCFAGAKAVDWCIANRKSSSRQEAVLFLTTLLQKGAHISLFHFCQVLDTYVSM